MLRFCKFIMHRLTLAQIDLHGFILFLPFVFAVSLFFAQLHLAPTIPIADPLPISSVRFVDTDKQPSSERGTSFKLQVMKVRGIPIGSEWLGSLATDAQSLEISPSFLLDVIAGKQNASAAHPFARATETSGPILFANGHGSLHHLSFYFLRDFVEPRHASYSLIVFDQHDDARNIQQRDDPANADHGIDCGNWVRFALAELSGLRRAFLIGRAFGHRRVWSDWITPDYFPGDRLEMLPAQPMTLFSHVLPAAGPPWQTCRHDLTTWLTGIAGYQLRLPGFSEDLLEQLLTRIPTSCVYLSVDLDVLVQNEFHDLRWGCGALTVSQVTRAIELIGRRFEIIGADITGYPPLVKQQTRSDDARNQKAYTEVFLALKQAMLGTGTHR